MAIVGIGLDIVELERISRIWERFNAVFARRILAQSELHLLPAKAIPYLASRFAAKEATAKALGTGFRQGITFRQIEVISRPTGQPTLILHENARARAEALGTTRMHLSLTHGRDVAAAVVILENSGA
jgi:holo-[acyl-carrier protein] synthase